MPLHAIVKKCSIETRESDDSWEEPSVDEVREWGWESEELAYNEQH